MIIDVLEGEFTTQNRLDVPVVRRLDDALEREKGKRKEGEGRRDEG